MAIQIYKPVICKTPHHRIQIFDERGVLFYDSKWAKKFRGVFTLPKGTYSSEQEFKVVRPLRNRKLKLKRFERNKMHNWDSFTIKYAPNPHKCTIFHDKNLIIFDLRFKHAPKFQLVFILLHEKGHNYYKTESKADWYAIRGMWARGYNKSQIGLAPILTLSDRNWQRKKIVVDYLIKKLK